MLWFSAKIQSVQVSGTGTPGGVNKLLLGVVATKRWSDHLQFAVGDKMSYFRKRPKGGAGKTNNNKMVRPPSACGR